MLKSLFTILMTLHGMIHMIGFFKAFAIADFGQKDWSIPRSAGAMWLVVAIGFGLSAIMFALGRNRWCFVALSAVALSQTLILLSWQYAKFGTVANLIVATVAVVGLGSFFMQHRFERLVRSDLAGNDILSTDTLTEDDIAHLPQPVQRYLRYTQSVGRPKVRNFRAEFVGGIRGKANEPYMELQSLQYNFLQNPSRYFFMTAGRMGLPATGLHLYQNGTATFEVRLLNWLPVVSARGERLDQAETVTLFNDMCFIAPATLIDGRIAWEQMDGSTVKAVFTNRGISVRAVLYFNEKGELVDFMSPDRYETDGRKYENHPWRTPVSEYRERNGYLLPSKARLIYEKPEGDFTYGELEYKDVRYNVSEFTWGK